MRALSALLLGCLLLGPGAAARAGEIRQEGDCYNFLDDTGVQVNSVCCEPAGRLDFVPQDRGGKPRPRLARTWQGCTGPGDTSDVVVLITDKFSDSPAERDASGKERVSTAEPPQPGFRFRYYNNEGDLLLEKYVTGQGRLLRSWLSGGSTLINATTECLYHGECRKLAPRAVPGERLMIMGVGGEGLMGFPHGKKRCENLAIEWTSGDGRYIKVVCHLPDRSKAAYLLRPRDWLLARADDYCYLKEDPEGGTEEDEPVLKAASCRRTKANGKPNYFDLALSGLGWTRP